MGNNTLGGRLNQAGNTVSSQLRSVHFHVTSMEKRVAFYVVVYMVLHGAWRYVRRWNRRRRLARMAPVDGHAPRNWVSDAGP
jgi:hypothetical protein